MSSLSKQNLLVFACGVVLGSWIHYLILSRRKSSQLERIERALERLSFLVDTNNKEASVKVCAKENLYSSPPPYEGSQDYNDSLRRPVRAQSPIDERFYDTQDSFTFEQTSDIINEIDYEELGVRLDNPETDFAATERELSTFERQYSKDPEFWWHYAKTKYMLGKSDQYLDDTEGRKRKFEEAHKCAQKALELDDNNANAHKWAAITIGSLADYVGLRERISNGLAFHRHLEAAMERKKDDPTLFHLSGRFIIQIVALSWIEKKLVSTFVDELPPVDNRQAIEYFYEAHRLKPKWRENHLFLAQTLVADSRKSEAKKIVKESLEMMDEGVTQEERQVHGKLVNLLNTL